MKKVFVGLGNPGEKYHNNRHNIGFMFIDYFIEKLRITDYELENTQSVMRNKSTKFNSIIFEVKIEDQKLLMVEPQTYMNKSGEAVRNALDYYKFPIDDLVVIYDDLDIRFGDFKIHDGKGPRTHNGLLSLEKYLKTQIFTQVRIGVDNRSAENRIDGETYVLRDFTADEKKQLMDDIFPRVLQRMALIP